MLRAILYFVDRTTTESESIYSESESIYLTQDI